MAESQMLQRLIQELEYLIQLSSQHVDMSKKRICNVKDVMNVPSRQLANRNESKQSKDTLSLHNLTDEQVRISFQDEDDMLEEEIKRILQVAENVMDKAVIKQSHKSKVIHSCADKKMTRIIKSEATCSPGVKVTQVTAGIPTSPTMCHNGFLQGPTLRSKFTYTGVKSVKKTITKSDVKTVYQKDFSLVKSKSMPSLCGEPKSNEVIKCRTLERKCYHQDKKMVPTQSKAVGLNSKQSAPRSNKDFIKINKQNLGLVKKETPRDTKNSKGVYASASRLLNSSKVNESLLCEELALRSQLPNHSEVLMVLREVYHFLTGSNRKESKKEVMLREKFIERCNSSASKCDSEPELHGILSLLLPHCGWAYGRNKIIAAKDLSSVKEIITELEEKLHSVQCSLKYIQKNDHNAQPESKENLSLKESPFWDPLVMSSVFQGVNLPPYLYYNNVCEWISFQNAVLELHEYYIQSKVLEYIHPIITEVLGSMDSNDAIPENIDEDLIKSLAQLLKAASVMADFTGHLTVPILAGIKSINNSSTNH